MTDLQITDQVATLVSRVEKLWRRANHPGTPPEERKAAQAKALSLMSRHQITEAMLREHTPDDEIVDTLFGEIKGTYGRLMINIIDSIGRHYGVKVYYKQSRKNYEVFLFGFKSDCERVKALSTMLLSEAVSDINGYVGQSRADTFDYKRSYLVAYGNTVSSRLFESLQDVIEELPEEDQKGVSLVLVSRKKQVNERMKVVHSNMTVAEPLGWTSSTRGFADGRQKGNSVPLNLNAQVQSAPKELTR